MLRRQAHPRRRGERIPPGDQRPARPRLHRHAGRRPRREDRGGEASSTRRRGSRRRARSATPAPSRRRSPCSPGPQRPLLIAGSGVWWSDGAAALQAFVEASGIPFYTKPISRGLIPEDHALSFLNARSTGVHRGRRPAGRRHALRLDDPVRPAAALRRRPQGHPRGRQPGRARPQPRGRCPDRRRRARGARAAHRRGARQARPQALRQLDGQAARRSTPRRAPSPTRR